MNYMECYLQLQERIMPFGRERSLLEYIASLAAPYGDEIWFDLFGNLIVHKRGNGKRVMVSAQADVPTAVITYIEKDGTGRFLMTGKGEKRIANGTHLRFGQGIEGIVEYDDAACCDTDLSQMRIRLNGDGGVLHVGDKGVLTGPCMVNKLQLEGPSCGEMAGCMALLDAMRQYNTQQADLFYVFTVGSEAELVSQRGVLCGAYHLKPDIGISIEAIDAHRIASCCGDGPVVLLRDEHAVLRKQMKDILREAAGETILVQYAALAETERETAMYHYQCSGADSAVLCIPTEQYHTCREKVVLSDVEQLVGLLHRLIDVSSQQLEKV